MHFLDNRTILVTGGTGSFGKAIIKKIINETNANKIIVFSRDELKQFEMQDAFKTSKIHYQLGDVRDFERLNSVFSGVDFVIHAAAMKQIPASENNPSEAIKTNIIGAENVINASIANRVKKVIALSTDKASNPINLYGATKLCSDKLMVAGNKINSNQGTKFSAVRYGNVLGSRGSVIPFFLEQKKFGVIPITDVRMTRFWITLNQGVDFVLTCLSEMLGGEIFVPKIPSFKVTDLAEIIAPDVPKRVVGIRPGEKIHEVMITEDDAPNTVETNFGYAILTTELLENMHYSRSAKKVPESFRYSSENNPLWFTPESFRKLLEENGILN